MTDNENELSHSIAKRIRAMRKSRNMTMEQLSECTGVSQPMLSQIERQKSIPTITTLWKIATGLRVPLSVLIEEEKPVYRISTIDNSSPIESDQGKMKAWSLFPFDSQLNAEFYEIELKPGCRHLSGSHIPGTEEFILVKSGQFRLVLDGQPMDLNENQSIRFQADRPHGYFNVTEVPCRIYNVIFYLND